MSECQSIVCCEKDPFTYEIGASPQFFNTEQCYTANCPDGETGDPVTVCIAAGTYSDDTQDGANAMAYAAAQDAATAALVCSGPGCSNLIPNMTSNTAPSGIAAASTARGANVAWKAFDGNFVSGTSTWQSNAIPAWVRYKFVTAKVVKAYRIYTVAIFTGATPKDFTFEGSDDSSFWTVLDTQVTQTFVDLVPNTYSFANTTPYLFYRLNISNTSDNSKNSVLVVELQMFPCASP